MKRLALASTAILAAIAFILGRADARGFGGARVGGLGAGAGGFRGAGLGVAGVAGAGGVRTGDAGRVGAIGNRSVVARGFAGRGYGRGYGRGLGYGLAGVGLGVGYGLGGFGYDSCDSRAYDPVSCNHYGYGY
jgi:hypothetical protein